ncbi:glycerol-3-phosphate dehydrogenase [Granulosicoccus antarcticus]|uniref:Glycerol-3-phosphate dehydrogenase n=1 Tax=Granulosicoccus antarcticus IMCC3135 TaxID=1192854 RepID=A0A2Z2NH08_9GAMM|nr:glycerol-3-phosphate dehydrogenase [Granulosicoccus antarcticus]ASJ70576.1 Aerobic glycerol-3-phosphate dehydrogenase [Granulosicoccus antarcticus IMCC3135]
MSIFDLVVIGGGVNGAGIARDAAGRGLKVLLCEKDDFAQHTSSSSSKLIHGGLRYLEYYDFKLVRHALNEREVLLRAAPHIIWPLRFILPHHKALRPRWLIRIGLFLYDNLGGRKLLPASNSVDLTTHLSGAALKKEFKSGFEYSDCWVQDARLVVLNVMDAQARGCDVRVRCECTDIIRDEGQWQVKLQDHLTGKSDTVTARAIVNASGPWVEKTLDLDEEHESRYGVRLVKGSHVVVPKLFDHPYTYIFQNADNRILFAIPYENDFTLLGTTDVEIEGEPGTEVIEQDEIDYICRNASEYFDTPVSPEQVVWTYTGVRPLYDDASENASKVTRDYKLDLDTRTGAPLLSVYGGKITTFRKLAEETVDMLKSPLGFNEGAWTASESLPGGDIPDADFAGFLAQCQDKYAWMDDVVLLDYARNYGTCISVLVGKAGNMQQLGHHFGGPLYQAEVEYLIAHEYARSAADILWRRSKKGLHTPKGTEEILQQWIDQHYDFATTIDQLATVS